MFADFFALKTPRRLSNRAKSRHLGRRRPLLETLEGRALLATATPTLYAGALDIPTAIIAGPDGNLWVANSGSGDQSSITVVGTDGSVKANYTIPTANASVAAMTVGPDGNVWFVEQGTDTIGVITPTGAITEYPIPASELAALATPDDPTPTAAPSSIVAGADGALYFTEPSADAIGRITPAGVITQIPTPNLSPNSIAVGPDHDVWFTDTANDDTIDRLNTDGSISTFAIPTANAQPQDLTLGPDGALWFVEAFNQSVGRITPDGTVTEIPIRAGLNSPQAIAFDSAENLWIAGSGNTDLVRITPQGNTIDVGDGNNSISSVTLGPDNAIWFTDDSSNQVGTHRPRPASPALPMT